MLKLYTDESPGLKVDPFVVMVLSIGFIISVVALHSEYSQVCTPAGLFRSAAVRFQINHVGIFQGNIALTDPRNSPRKGHQAILFVNESITREKRVNNHALRQIKEHGVWIWRDFFFIQLLFIFSLLLRFGAGKADKSAFVLCIPKTARSLATIVPHDRLFFSETTRC
jgi:hypothetical protein